MKRFFAILSLSLLVLMLTACGKNSTDAVDSGKPGNVTTPQVTTTNAPVNTGEENTTPTPAVTESVDTPVTTTTEVPTDNEKGDDTDMDGKMKVQIGSYTFTATLEDNAAVGELVEMMKQAPVVLNLDDYSGFEKVGPLGKSLTRSDKQTTTEKGDIVLYSGSNIVIFYGSNSWSYTRLGKIDDLTDWDKALGSGSVTVTFSID